LYRRAGILPAFLTPQLPQLRQHPVEQLFWQARPAALVAPGFRPAAFAFLLLQPTWSLLASGRSVTAFPPAPGNRDLAPPADSPAINDSMLG
jgi:hypothetical protein